MKINFRGIFVGLVLTTLSSVGFAESDLLVGKWKTIDDRTGYSRADVEIRKKPDGTYEGIIVETRNIPGAEKMVIVHPPDIEENIRSSGQGAAAFAPIIRYSKFAGKSVARSNRNNPHGGICTCQSPVNLIDSSVTPHCHHWAKPLC